MGSLTINKNRPQPHVVCIPYPAQGHINPMTKLAKLLHYKGFYVTFVHTEFNYKRLLRSRGPNSLDGLPSFRFEAIPDGLPESNADATQDIPSLCESTRKNCLKPFKELLSKLNSKPDVPRVTCIVSDGAMSFTLEAARDLGVPEVVFWTTSACGFLAYLNYRQLIEKGVTPLKDESYTTNGYLDNTVINWIPGMRDMRLRDFPSFVRTTDRDDIMLNFADVESQRAKKASAVVLNTFDTLEKDVLDSLSSMLPPVYTVGPLNLLLNQIPDESPIRSIGSNLWKEEPYCLEWLDSKAPNSVVYVNFGSITVMTPEQLVEFAWGLANSNKIFLWIIRPDLVVGEAAVLPPEFVSETKERGLLDSWCPQEQVLSHPAVGAFLTHSGWNSTLESISFGVPMICWPFFAEQQTNCRYCCREWGIGMEVENAERRNIEGLVRELMDGEKGEKMKKRVTEWKKLAEDATSLSLLNLDKMIEKVLRSPATV